MKCPFDGATLQVVNRSGIEIDWCPDCRGVWLERGELDQLIDRLAPEPAPPTRPQRPDRDFDDWDDETSRRYDDGHRDGSRRKRGGLLSEIFDF